MSPGICILLPPQNHALTVSQSQGPELLRALCLASGNTEIRLSSGKIAKEWRFENEAQGVTVLKSHSIAKSYCGSFTFARSRALTSPVLGKRKG